MSNVIRTHLYTIAAITASITPFLVIGILFFLMQNTFYYGQTEIIPKRSLLCAGDLLEYDVTLVVTSPTVMRVARQWRPVGGTAFPLTIDESTDMQPDVGVVTSTIALEVPDLAPGPYELIGVRYSRTTQPAFYRVPLTVLTPESCDNGPNIAHRDAWDRR